jgi:phage FluMu protein Com
LGPFAFEEENDVHVTRPVADANGDLTAAMRTVRCFVCDARLVDVSGTQFRVEAKCGRCKTHVIIERPMTGEVARRFGIRPGGERVPELAGAGA